MSEGIRPEAERCPALLKAAFTTKNFDTVVSLDETVVLVNVRGTNLVENSVPLERFDQFAATIAMDVLDLFFASVLLDTANC